ncbi:dihydrolipoyl dehydrogenase [Desertibacillus haloalkaliphilus]|uniref:dihydrolipoyl dehydrogenase n=1 Tax=Desertibacillus haloalkaliphilus TaxID=1328930 RepID=UPI001C27DB2C|nr:dihydrolipoyl dehydrogenase [Desertibacillus haloalkaliphilus]MBU8906123.1 dihydrolipoyl dehydrogenase [Desertibacillus haloalkaliphilus]
MQKKWQTVVIGGGPGGYAAAIRAAQLGLKTVLIEKQHLGGTCLNVGCIPTKYMVELANSTGKVNDLENLGVDVTYHGLDLIKFQKSKQKVVKQLTGGVNALLKRAGAEVISGTAEFVSDNQIKVMTEKETIEIEAENIIIAAGTRPTELLIPFDGEHVVSSTDVLNWKELPQSLTIVGAGVIGMEFASIFSQLGVNVSVVEVAPHALMNEDQDAVNYLVKALKNRGVQFHLNTKVVSSSKSDREVTLFLEKDSQQSSLSSEKVLIAAGRTSNADTLQLDKTSIQADRGFIKVNKQMQTDVKHIYAVGDIVGSWQLAHAAYDEGVVAAENIAGQKVEFEDQFVPRSVFTSPEISSVGLTEKQAREQYNQVKAYKVPLQGNGKALINGLGRAEGMAKIIVDEKYGEIVGFSIVGEHVNELVTGVTSIMSLESTIEEVASIIHPHPSLSEVIKELALLAEGKPLHSM